MSLNCDIVKDMVVLYKDDCVNESTKAQINEHLCECKSCRKYYKRKDKPKTQYERIRAYTTVYHRIRIIPI